MIAETAEGAAQPDAVNSPAETTLTPGSAVVAGTSAAGRVHLGRTMLTQHTMSHGSVTW